MFTCHFMTRCILFNEKRVKLLSSLKIGNVSNKQNDMTKFIVLLTDMLKAEDTCQNVGRYIYECFKLQSCHKNSTSSSWSPCPYYVRFDIIVLLFCYYISYADILFYFIITFYFFDVAICIILFCWYFILFYYYILLFWCSNTHTDNV